MAWQIMKNLMRQHCLSPPAKYFFKILTISSLLATFAHMVIIRKTEHYVKWLNNLRDIKAKARILVRIERLAGGNPSDVKPVGEGVSELHINYGPGYRVYISKTLDKNW